MEQQESEFKKKAKALEKALSEKERDCDKLKVTQCLQLTVLSHSRNPAPHYFVPVLIGH